MSKSEKLITFHNITVFVSAEDATTAYKVLCDALEYNGIEYNTDTYSVDDGEEHNTVDLF